MSVRKILIFIVGILMSATVVAQKSTSVLLSLKNGSRIKCNIVEVTPKQTKIETSDGSVFVYSSDQVLSIVPLQTETPQQNLSTQTSTSSNVQVPVSVVNNKVSIAEPEYAGEIVYAENGNKAVNLETQTIKIKTQGNASLYVTGIGAVTTRYEVEGVTSPIKIKASKNDTLRFICSAKDNSENPRDYLCVFKMEQSKKRRFAEVGKASTYGGVESKGNQSLSFTATKYGNHSYLIEISGLKSGEYGFNMTSNPSRVFCFSFDNGSSDMSISVPVDESESVQSSDYEEMQAQMDYLKREMALSKGKPWRVDQGGYKGFVDLECRISSSDEDNLMITTSHGYQFGSHLFLGGGVGVAKLTYNYDEDTAVPLFFDIRTNFFKSRFTPVFGMKLGYDLSSARFGACYDFSLGCKFRIRKKMAVNLSLQVGGYEDTYATFGPSIGFEW